MNDVRRSEDGGMPASIRAARTVDAVGTDKKRKTCPLHSSQSRNRNAIKEK